MKKANIIFALLSLLLFYSCKKNSVATVVETKDSLSEHLLAFYPFNGNALDESGNNNNLVVHGATLTQDRFGNIQKAYEFNGADQYMNIPKFSPDSLHQSFTISLWAKPEGNFSSYLLSLHSDSSIDCVNSVWIENGAGGHNIRCNYAPSFPPQNLCTAYLLFKPIPDSSGKWMHVAMVVEKPNPYIKSFYLYLDGESVSSGTSDISASTFNYGGVIGTAIFNAYFYKGALDDIRIYDKAFSESEILELYHLQK
ncbi:MAG: LamG domain-containing protein [Ginsengibacter sp.]